MMKFTTRKWNMDAKTIRVSCRVLRTIRAGDSDIEDIAFIPSHVNCIPEQEALANARLIVAAPKMYELLGMAMQSLRHHSDNDCIIACHIGELLASIDGEESEQRRQNMSKFTPGKWEARPNRVIANGRPLAIVNGGNSANTRLMAAAPEMYELLQELAGTSAPGHYVEHFMELKDKARELLTRIDGDSDVKTQESEP